MRATKSLLSNDISRMGKSEGTLTCSKRPVNAVIFQLKAQGYGYKDLRILNEQFQLFLLCHRNPMPIVADLT